MKLHILSFFSIVFLLSSCTPEQEPPVIQSGDADFTSFVAIGDGYLSGYQDGALTPDGQTHSIAALIFSSMEQAGSTNFYQALMPDNSGFGLSSKPWEGLYITSSKMGDRVDCEGVTSLGPVKTFHTSGTAQPFLDAYPAAALNDFTFPFANVSHWLNPNFASQNVFYNRVASSFGGNTSILNAALTRNPTFFVSWPGMEDIFQYARNGGRGQTIITPQEFSLYLDTIFTALTSTGAKGVIATIPDFDAFPYYTTIPWNVADLNQEDADTATYFYGSAGMTHITFQEGKNGLVIEDANAPFGYRNMLDGDYFTLIVPTDSMKCYYYGLIAAAIHDRYVLDTAEVSFLRNRIDDFNSVITQKAMQYGLALADMNSYFDRIKSGGILSQGVLFTNEFVRGGFFSLDGYYPTQKGAALIANQFILAINAYFHSSIPTIYCGDCSGVLFP